MGSENAGPARRVLVAVSSSKGSKDALIWTLDKLIRTPDDILVLLHVLKPIEYVATSEGYMDAAQLDPKVVHKIGIRAREKGGELLESYEALCVPRRVEALTKLVEGDRRKMILEEVERMGATDLVMGGKGRRIMPKLKSTNLTDYCMKHAACQVSIIRKGHVIHSASAKRALPHKPSTSDVPPSTAVAPNPITKPALISAPILVTFQNPVAKLQPTLSDSDRARWRSTADVAADVSSNAAEQDHTGSGGLGSQGGVQNAREITPGEGDTASDFMARFLNKARAEELTLALAQLDKDGDGSVFQKGVGGDCETAANRKPDSKVNPETAAASSSPRQETDRPSASAPKDGVTSADDVAAGGKGDDVAASEAARLAVSDKEVDPNSLSLTDEQAEELKRSRQLVTDARDSDAAFDSDASVFAHENSFGEFMSQSSLDGDLLSLLAMKSVAPNVEKAGEVDGFIQYKRPQAELEGILEVSHRLSSSAATSAVHEAGISVIETSSPGYARGLEVLEVLDRWLVAKQAEQLYLASSTVDTCHAVVESGARDVPARASAADAKQPKKGGRFGRLFRGRGKKDAKGENAAEVAADVGADVAGDVSEIDPAVEEFWQDTPPSTAAADGPGLLSRIADVIIAEEAEKARHGADVGNVSGADVSNYIADDTSILPVDYVSNLPGNDVSESVRAGSAGANGQTSYKTQEFGDDVAGSTPLDSNHVVEETGSPCEELERTGSREGMRRMFQDEDAETGDKGRGQSPSTRPLPTPPQVKPQLSEPQPSESPDRIPRPPITLKAAVPEGIVPGGRVKVKVQMLNTEARGSEPGALAGQTDARLVQSVPSSVLPGVSKRVSRALLEGMVPELPRTDPEDAAAPDAAARAATAAVSDGPASDNFRTELSKYTLDGWLGIGQCVSRFLEDDRSSMSSEAYDSVGGSMVDSGTPVSCTWGGDPSEAAASGGAHVAGEDWGYGSSRLGASARGEVTGDKSPVPGIVAEARAYWEKQAAGNVRENWDAARNALETSDEVPRRGGEMAEDRGGEEDEQGSVAERDSFRGGDFGADLGDGPLTDAAVLADFEDRRELQFRSSFSNYWTSGAASDDPDDVTIVAPKFGGIALRHETRPVTPLETLAAVLPPSSRNPDASFSGRRTDRRGERDAYDPRRWAVPLGEEAGTGLQRNVDEAELLDEFEEPEFSAPPFQEESTTAESLSALSISQAITDLATSAFSDLVTDGRIATSQVSAWQDEIAWLTSPAENVTELVASTVETRTGSMKDVVIQRLRPDVQTSLPALRSLDAVLQRIVLRLNAGAAASTRELMSAREQTVQILKATLMINEEVLEEMAVPAAYWEALPQTIKQALGSDLFHLFKSASPAHLLAAVNPKTPAAAWRVVNNLEAAALMWRSMLPGMAEPVARKRATYAVRAAALVHDLKMTWPTLECTELTEYRVTRNTDIGRAVLESYSRALISLCGKTITCLDHLLTLERPERSGRRPRTRQSSEGLSSASGALRQSGSFSRQSSSSGADSTADTSNLRRSVNSLPSMRTPPNESLRRQSTGTPPKAEGLVRRFFGLSRRKSVDLTRQS